MDIPDEIFVHVIASGNAEPHVIANVITAGVDDQPEVKLFLLLGNELAITDLADALDLGAKHSTDELQARRWTAQAGMLRAVWDRVLRPEDKNTPEALEAFRRVEAPPKSRFVH